MSLSLAQWMSLSTVISIQISFIKSDRQESITGKLKDDSKLEIQRLPFYLPLIKSLKANVNKKNANSLVCLRLESISTATILGICWRILWTVKVASLGDTATLLRGKSRHLLDGGCTLPWFYLLARRRNHKADWRRHSFLKEPNGRRRR